MDPWINLKFSGENNARNTFGLWKPLVSPFSSSHFKGCHLLEQTSKPSFFLVGDMINKTAPKSSHDDSASNDHYHAKPLYAQHQMDDLSTKTVFG